MSDSKETQNRIGFSTGALERGNYRAALEWLREKHIRHVELSALRFEELAPLVGDLDTLPMDEFSYISFHAPSAFPEDAEPRVVELLKQVVARGWNVVVHPDVIRDSKLWEPFGRRLLLENMDRRKPGAGTAEELALWFRKIPEARLCLDVAHARQLDTTLTLLAEILETFRDRIAQLHISELDSHCRHQPMSVSAVADYKGLASELRPGLPVIIESVLEGSRSGMRMQEVELAREATECDVPAPMAV